MVEPFSNVDWHAVSTEYAERTGITHFCRRLADGSRPQYLYKRRDGAVLSVCTMVSQPDHFCFEALIFFPDDTSKLLGRVFLDTDEHVRVFGQDKLWQWDILLGATLDFSGVLAALEEGDYGN